MSRARNIKPGLFRNESLADCDPLGRLLFVGLWCLADREGRLEDRPKRIKADLLPYDDCNVDELLDQLAARAFIVRYSVGPGRFIQVINFAKHQNPHVKEAASTIPASDSTEDGQAAESGEPSAGTVLQAGRALPRQERAGLIPYSLIPDHGFPHPETNAAKIAGEPRLRGESSARSSSGTSRSEPEREGFADFWTAYPRRDARRDAVKAWESLRPDAQLLQCILESLTRFNRSEQWTKDGGRYVPLPATWLRGRRWEDEVGPARIPAGNCAEPKTCRAEDLLN